jgi:hypothetical protein
VTLTQYVPRLVVLGAHYETYENIRITELTAEMDLLDDWIGISGFQTKVGLKEPPEISMEYRRPDNVVLFTSPDVEWQIRWKVTLPAMRIPQKEVSVGERPYFYAAAKSPVPFDTFQREAQQFRKLVALWLGAPVQMTALSAVDTESGDRHALEFLWASGLDERKPSQVRLHEIVRFGDLQADLQRVIAFYRENETTVGPVIALWDLLPFQEDIHREQRFLNYCQIAEAFHRRTIGGTDRSPEKYAAFLKVILEAVPQEHHEWLEGKLSFANEFSFQRRIRDLCKRSNVNSTKFPIEKGAFSNRVSFIRNYLTHFKLKEGDMPPEPQEVVTLGHYLKTLVEVSILRWLQMSDAIIEKRLKLRVFEAPPYKPFGK